MENAYRLQYKFKDESQLPAMVMLKPSMSLVGSTAEGTRGGGMQECDIMLKLKGIKSSFLLKTDSATKIRLSKYGKKFFRK